jgi:hypothetical protein
MFKKKKERKPEAKKTVTKYACSHTKIRKEQYLLINDLFVFSTENDFFDRGYPCTLGIS